MRRCLDTRIITPHLLLLAAVGLCVLVASSRRAAHGQQVQPRDISSEDFSRNRSSVNPSSRPASPGSKKRRYRLVSTRPAAKAPTDSLPEQVGITIWRLRASTADDQGPKIPVREGGGTTWWTPERARAGTPFNVGDRVRLSIESPRAGYLYVIDREQYSDGTLGAPFLIFPTLQARGGDNRVSAGVLIDIPDQTDRTPYFELTAGRSDLVGEVLTVLVTPQRLKDISVPPKRIALASELVSKWESLWATQTELFEMEGGAGATWTKAEQRASSVSGRSLTQDEPTPQTIYRVRVKPGSPLLVTVPLSYGRTGHPE